MLIFFINGIWLIIALNAMSERAKRLFLSISSCFSCCERKPRREKPISVGTDNHVQLTTMVSGSTAAGSSSTSADIEGGTGTMQMNPLLLALEEQTKKLVSKEMSKE